MGASRGGGYAPGKTGTRRLYDNHKQAGNKYGTSRNGWLGQPGNRPYVQVIKSADPAATAYDVFSIFKPRGNHQRATKWKRLEHHIRA